MCKITPRVVFSCPTQNFGNANFNHMAININNELTFSADYLELLPNLLINR